MSERNPMYQHPEWDIPGSPKALIGQEPVTKESSDLAEDLVSNAPQAETAPENPLDIPSLIRLFQTDAYPLPEGAPVRIAVGKETSLTLHPNEEAVEYRQETPNHTIYLRASKAGEVAFSLTPTLRGATTQEQPVPPPQGFLPETVLVDGKALLLAAEEPGYPAKAPEATAPPKDQARSKENKDRVVVTGRVGREPTIKQIKTGLMAKFPVAEHQPDGSTTWRTIVAFGKQAESLRDSLIKGRMITVAGYPHEREVTGKAGQTRTVTEIYLAGLKHHK
jgi:hypothetical protein